MSLASGVGLGLAIFKSAPPHAQESQKIHPQQRELFIVSCAKVSSVYFPPLLILLHFPRKTRQLILSALLAGMQKGWIKDERA